MEFSTLNGYKVKDKKAIRFYDTVDDMKNDSTLKEGMYAKTKGYYSVNDGGASEYHITGTESNSDYQEELNNGLYATLIVTHKVSLKQLGAKNTEDVSTILQFVINLCKEKYEIIIDDYYPLSDYVTIDRPIKMIGLPSKYSNSGLCGFNCNNENAITYFYFNEGSVNCEINHLIFKNNNLGTCIRFSSRDDSLTDYRVWKNKFDTCRFINFATAINFYAVGNFSDYDYSSEMLFINCKFYNNAVACEYNNVQSYNTNFISTDFECDPLHIGKGFILNSYGGINIDGGSLILHDSLIKLGSNESLIPVNTFIGIVNISNCRFETFNETIFDYTLESRTANYQQHCLNITNTNFYTHNDGVLIDVNVRGLFANCNFTMTGGMNLTINAQSNQSASEYSRIIITTPQNNRILVPYLTGVYRPWVVVNNNILCSCVNNANGNNVFEYNNKVYLGFNKTGISNNISVTVPWYIRKFVININGAFINNTGTITITDGAGFTETFTKDVAGYGNVHDEIYLPYNENGKTYTITASNIYGNCYFE